MVIENSGIKATGYKIRHGVQGVNLTVRDSYFYGEPISRASPLSTLSIFFSRRTSS